MKFKFNEEVTGALHFDTPIVALESTVIAHGLPYPQNIETGL
jgi:pseudouridine-5'-phosphate glycosidase